MGAMATLLRLTPYSFATASNAPRLAVEFLATAVITCWQPEVFVAAGVLDGRPYPVAFNCSREDPLACHLSASALDARTHRIFA